jgi:hypothetical protein
MPRICHVEAHGGTKGKNLIFHTLGGLDTPVYSGARIPDKNSFIIFFFKTNYG